jgi:hypothetical protein
MKSASWRSQSELTVGRLAEVHAPFRKWSKTPLKFDRSCPAAHPSLEEMKLRAASLQYELTLGGVIDVHTPVELEKLSRTPVLFKRSCPTAHPRVEDGKPTALSSQFELTFGTGKGAQIPFKK